MSRRDGSAIFRDAVRRIEVMTLRGVRPAPGLWGSGRHYERQAIFLKILMHF